MAGPTSSDDRGAQMLLCLQHAYRVIAHGRRGRTLETFVGFPHGMPTTQAETIDADLLEFVRS